MWPGFGENFRVLQWMISRVHHRVGAVETPLGYVPEVNDLDLTGLNISPAVVETLLEVAPDEWQAELESQQQFFKQFGSALPAEIWQEHLALKDRLCAVKI